MHFVFVVQSLAVVYKIYPKDSSCKRDEKCDKSVRKRYTETEMMETFCSLFSL